MIPYYNPHFGLIDLLKTFFCVNAEAELEEKFRQLTGKKYILFTASCRSALYLAYKAIGKTGLVHTSPLTCQVAILPIWASGNETSFQDVKDDDWALDPEEVKKAITSGSIAIQAIHLGGFPCDMPALRAIADENNLVLIEDCAQGFGASIDGVPTGVLGDIACFTLTKNLYSLGGGVLATDNRQWFQAAKEHQKSFPKVSWLRLVFRVLITLLSSYRHLSVVEKLYQFLKNASTSSKSKAGGVQENVLNKELKQVPRLYLKSCAARWDKIQKLVKINKETAKETLSALKLEGAIRQNNPRSEPSYTKLFLALGQDSPQFIETLNNNGVEAMHLEHKHKVYYQEKLFEGEAENYHKLHDRVVSVPNSKRLNADMSAITPKSGVQSKPLYPRGISKVNFLVYLGHPSHYYVLRHLAKTLEKSGDSVTVIIKTKDVLDDLVKADGIDYINISKKRRKNNFLSIAFDVIARSLKFFYILKRKKIQCVLTCGSDLAFTAKLLRIPYMLFNDDDYHIVPNSAKYGWPYATKIFVPVGCDMGKFENKTLHYKGFQKSFYLDENVFTPNYDIVKSSIGTGDYSLVRIVSFDAHHDDDVEGIDSNLLSEIVSKLEAHGKVFISSEKKLPDEFNKYRLVIDPRDIHHYLNYASLVIGDSQSMIHEAALLGTPAIRYNSFIGKIGVFNLLENKYKLSIGIMAGDKEGLLAAIDRVMLDDGYKDQMKQNLKEMRADCEDVNQFVLDHLKGLVGNPDLDERDSKSI